MTSDELITNIAGGPVRLLFDTNALFSSKAVRDVCRTAARIEVLLLTEAHSDVRGDRRIRLLVPAPVHGEKLFDLKQNWRDRYDVIKVEEAVLRLGLVVVPFGAEHARRLAGLLGDEFDTPARWRDAKRQRCIECLGLKKLESQVKGSGRNCGATIDWLIAAHALAEDCVLVTDDRGPEFEQVTSKLKLDTLREALHRVLDDPACLQGREGS
ncbi:hypothetical protein [Haliangium sp.]|uniref:hypothetical protein n=1 Tax=Haliangium sp. TaxID=2663208 RepID=UPI003D134E49